MAIKRIFVSYDYDNDRNYRYLLSAWDANKAFAFRFEDHSTPKINSEDAGRVKAAISARMAGAACLLVIVGEKTYASEWVAWEIQKAKDLGLSLLGVKIKSANVSPPGLLGAGATWAMSFTEGGVTTAVDGC